MFNLEGFKYQHLILATGMDLILICSDVLVKIQELGDSAHGDIFVQTLKTIHIFTGPPFQSNSRSLTELYGSP